MVNAGSAVGTITTTETVERWNFCPKCGQKLESTWKHCAGCGQLIESEQWWVWPTYPLYPPTIYPWTWPFGPGPFYGQTIVTCTPGAN